MKKWIISQLECVPKVDSYTDYVVMCHWRRVAEETIEGKDYYADVYGAQSFSTDNIQDFTPYDQLTYEEVCGWLDGAIDVASLDANLDKQIENQVNPPIVVLPLPWL